MPDFSHGISMADRHAQQRQPGSLEDLVNKFITLAAVLALVGFVVQFNAQGCGGGVELEVHRPDRVRADRGHRPDGDPDAGHPLLAAPVGDPQALLTPQPADPLVVDLPAGPARPLRGSSPPPPRPVLRKPAQPRPQLSRPQRWPGGSRRWVERC